MGAIFEGSGSWINYVTYFFMLSLTQFPIMALQRGRLSTLLSSLFNICTYVPAHRSIAEIRNKSNYLE